MSKITVLPYEAPYCVQCGRNLPKGRKRKCYDCQPPKTYCTKKPKPAEPASYTINDRVAQTVAYGISYGQLMAIIKDGRPLPEMKKPIRWPEGSEHEGG